MSDSSVRMRPYQYYDQATSICSECFRKVDAKIVFQDDNVYLDKRCPHHGFERVLIADDVEYYRRAREVFMKPSEMPKRFNTPIKYGCPYDCGLCPDHEQHSCLTVLEIADHCNLACPICYANSGPHRPEFQPLDNVLEMLDAIVANEGEPDVVQISGGEPTLHPNFFEILEAAKARPIKHVMVNTNGLKIAEDEEFTQKLASYMPGFELYLQFDSLKKDPLMALRGADLRRVREEALERLNRHGISTTLVVTLKKGLNDEEVGDIIDYALQQPCVRGVTFQPVQEAGRLEGFDRARDRLTLTEVRRLIYEQSPVFAPEDIIPVPCHPTALAMGYALKRGGKVTPLTGMIDPKVLIEGGRNTIVFERDESLKEEIFKCFSTAHSPSSAIMGLKELLCCLPKVSLPKKMGYENLFRVIIMEFLDAPGFDLRSVKKSCVHFVDPRNKNIIPFDTYNLFYRDDLEQTRLAPLRAEVMGTPMPNESAKA